MKIASFKAGSTATYGIVTDAGGRPPALANTALWLLRDNPAYWQFWLPVGALAVLWLKLRSWRAAPRYAGS